MGALPVIAAAGPIVQGVVGLAGAIKQRDGGSTISRDRLIQASNMVASGQVNPQQYEQQGRQEMSKGPGNFSSVVQREFTPEAGGRYKDGMNTNELMALLVDGWHQDRYLERYL